MRREGVRSLLNFVGCALGGCHDEAIELAARVLAPTFGPAQASLIGRTERPDMLERRVPERRRRQCPRIRRHPPADRHAPGGAGRARRCWPWPSSGRSPARALLHALILGIETGCRVGVGLMPTHYRRGWHITATCGIFSGAAAAGKLLGLDARHMAWSLGHAATQSAGLVESLGSMSKSIGVGNAARNGLAAALFAEAGFTAAERAIEGRYGFAPVTSDLVDLGAMTDGLGERWEILANAYKPYPCGVVLFPVIDACLELRAKHAPAAERIARVVVRGHPLMRERTDRPDVEDGRSAKVSLQHSAAVAFLFGAAGLAQYEDACVADPAVRALRAKVAFQEDAAVPVESAIVELHLADGTILSEHVRHGRGTPGRPMSDDELDAKVRELMAFGAPFVDAPALIAAIRASSTKPTCRKIIRMTEPKRA